MTRDRAARAAWTCVGVGVLAGLCAVGGACSQAPLRPHQTDEQFEAVLEERFAGAETLDDVDSRLDGLNVDREQRRWYPDAGICVGGQYLARVFEPGGRWLDRDDATIEWVDTWFVFSSPGRSGTLIRWYIHRGSQRYFEGEPIYPPPKSETVGPTRRWPFPPPLPARPPQ